MKDKESKGVCEYHSQTFRSFVMELLQFEFIFLLVHLGAVCFATDQISTTMMHLSTEAFPIDLYDLGFYGSWQQFCDTKEIDREFSEFPEHDLKNTRLMLCFMKTENKVDEKNEKLLAFGAYKYCLVMRSRFDELLVNLISELSENKLEQRKIIMNPDSGPVNTKTSCYNQTVEAFYKKCSGKYNPCNRMFTTLLGRSCFAHWLLPEDILKAIDKVCTGKYITDDVDWDAIFRSIKYGGKISRE